MKNLILTISLAAVSVLFMELTAQCTVNRFCLKFENPTTNTAASQFEFDMVMSGDEAFGLGSSNVQFRYNNAALSSPTIVSTQLGPPTYQTTSITTPFIPSLGENVASLNVELNTEGAGQNIPTTGTIIARVRFTITNPALLSNLVWYYNGGTTQTIVYDHNESTQLCAVTDDTACLEGLSSVLPVKLTSFGVEGRDKSLYITWTTEDEVNLDGYELQRSAAFTNDFQKVTFVSANGTTSDHLYAYTDDEVEANMQYYYRLKMMDLDGSFSYSEVISGSIEGEEAFVKLFPNPVHSSDMLHIRTGFDGYSTLLIRDGEGRTVLTTRFEKNTQISTENFTSGTYYYQLINGSVLKAGLITVMK